MQKVYKLLLFLFWLPIFATGQNLVPNPSFEDYTLCPTTFNNFPVLNWFRAGHKGEPYYFNSCEWTGGYGVPSNFVGYQNPVSGVAYAGIITYDATIPPNDPNIWRIYLGVELIDELIIGNEYFVSAYFSRAGGNSNNGGTFICSNNKFGFKFSTVQYEVNNPVPVNNIAHIFSNNIISDTVSWTHVYGSFIADSAYKYLNIGNFFDDVNTATSGPCTGTAFYYLDNVCVSTSPTECEITTSSPSPLQTKIHLYPNPASHSISLKNLTGSHSYSILTSTGYTIKTGSITEAENAIDVSAFPNGLYFLRLDGRESFKFVVLK